MDMSQGRMLSVASNQWATRPDDERFLSLSDMYRARHTAETNCRESVINSGQLRADWLGEELILQPSPDTSLPVTFKATNWAMSQFSSWHSIPFGTIKLWQEDSEEVATKQLISDAINHSLKYRGRELAFYHDKLDNGYPQTLRAVTSESYERINDYELIDKVIQFVDRSQRQGVTWKVPGTIDWSTGQHIADIEVTKRNTTLYAGDRDSFIFLVDDMNPINMGKTQRGEDDLLFRGFILGNSVVGYRRIWGMGFLFRGVCQNRCIWGAQDIVSFKMKHLKNVRQRLFESNPDSDSPFEQRRFVEGLMYLSDQQQNTMLQAENMIKSANQREEFTDRDSRKKALVKLFTARTADNILDHHYKLFGEVDSAGNLVVDSKGNVNTDSEILTRWHLHNTATEYAKTIPNQDARFDLELQAAKILPLAA